MSRRPSFAGVVNLTDLPSPRALSRGARRGLFTFPPGGFSRPHSRRHSRSASPRRGSFAPVDLAAVKRFIMGAAARTDPVNPFNIPYSPRKDANGGKNPFNNFKGGAYRSKTMKQNRKNKKRGLRRQ